MRLGAAFDPEAGGDGPALTREGGHSHNRIVHAGGDRSGAEVQRTLDESAVAAGVEVLERAFALDLVIGTAADGTRQAAGVAIALVNAVGDVESVGTVTARAVVLATGGYGQVFASTSNPPAVTGDGVALALRAGLPVRDVEFVQFHPTVMWTGPDAVGQQALVSEAVRGEGAILYDGAGQRVMLGVHPQEDLAPRDVVAAAISRRMAEAPGGIDDHVFLDATHMGERFYTRFPSITEACRAIGIDPAHDRIPVAPAAHYACGGVPARLDGTTAIAGLYAVGEVSCTGVHGANRLASNSLTESVVAGTRLGRDLAWEVLDRVEPDEDAAAGCRRRPAPAARDARRHVTPRRRRPRRRVAGHGGRRARRRRRQDRRSDAAVPGGVGGDEPADRRRRPSSPPPPPARRAVAATAARTSPSPATSGCATSTSGSGRTASSSSRTPDVRVPPAGRRDAPPPPGRRARPRRRRRHRADGRHRGPHGRRRRHVRRHRARRPAQHRHVRVAGPRCRGRARRRGRGDRRGVR